MTYEVGDRVRCISIDEGAPVGIVGTVVEVRHQVINDFETGKPYEFDYVVKYDEGQSAMMDMLAPNGIAEAESDLEPE